MNLGSWMSVQIKTTLSKSLIAQEKAYSHTKWDNLSAYLYDRNLQIDKILVQNAIRPVSLSFA